MKETNEEAMKLEQMKEFAELTPCGIGIYDIEKSQEIFINSSFLKILGYEIEEYDELKNNFNRIIWREDLDIIKKIRTTIKNRGKENNYEFRMIRKDGSLCWILLNLSIVALDGRQYAFASFTDISLSRENERKTMMEKERFKAVIDELDAAVFEWDLIEKSFYYSEAYKKYQISNINEEDLFNNRGSFDVIHPDDIPVLEKFFNESSHNKDRIETVIRLKRFDDSYHWCKMIGLFYRNEKAEMVRAVGILININEEHERLFLRDALLNELPGGVASFVVSDTVKCTYFNDGLADILERPKETLISEINDREKVNNIFLDGDYQDFVDKLMKCGETGKSFRNTYKLLMPDGTLKWIHLAISNIRETEGESTIYCVFTRPTEETEIYQNIVEDSPIGVYIIELNTRNIIYMNNTARKFAGIPKKRKIVGTRLEECLRVNNKKPFLNQDDIKTLSKDYYTEFKSERNDKYYEIKARILRWTNTDAYVLYISDETVEHKQQIQLQNLVNNVPIGIGIYYIDSDSKSVELRYLNDAYYEMLGFTRKTGNKIMGDPSLKSVYPDDKNSMKRLIENLINGSDLETVKYRVKNGADEWTWIMIVASVVERNRDSIIVYTSFSDCDALIKTQEEMEKSRIREQTLLSSIPGGVAIYKMKKDGRVVTEYASEALASLCGYDSLQEYMELIGENAMSGVKEEDIPLVMDAAIKSVEYHKPINIMYYIHRKDNGDVLNRLDAKIMDNRKNEEDDLAVWYAVHTLVSQESMRALEEQKHYSSVLEMLGIAYWEWSEDYGVYSSKTFDSYVISTVTLDDLLDRKISSDVAHPDEIEVINDFFDWRKNRKTRDEITVRMKMNDGNYCWTKLLMLREYGNDGNIKRFSCTLRDVNEEWQDQMKKLQIALDAAQSANRAKSSFLSRISHDMRTPLNGILGIADILKERITDECGQDDIKQLETSGEYLLALINDTLDMSRIESGHMELYYSVCDPKELLNSISELIKPIADSKKITVNINMEEITSPLIYIDEGRMKQIVMNIVDNAIKFSEVGDSIDIEVKKIFESSEVIKNQVTITDRGVGMSQEYLAHIFEPFSQEDTSKKNVRHGTGLGMSITKQLVEMMGGEIHIESQPGEGTSVRFTVFIPVATQAQIEDWEKTKRKYDVTEESDLSGHHILLCEDHPLNTKITCRLLEKKGIIIDNVENGKEGVEKFDSSPVGFYSAILMDVRMPVMDGLEATQKIRELAREDARTIPIIAMTANAFDEDIRQTHEAGMNAHLSKPISPKELYSVLSKSINNSPEKA